MEWAGQKKMSLKEATQIVAYSSLLYKRKKYRYQPWPDEPEIHIANIQGVSNMIT
jgi:hypothetical protein